MSLKSDAELQDILNKSCPTHKNVDKFNGCVLPVKFKNDYQKIAEMEVYDDDVWVTSFPKCGTTWVQEMVWCICKQMNFESAKIDLDERFPFLESSSINVGTQYDHLTNSIEYINRMERPRFIKTHLPWDLLPKQIQNFKRRPKIVHVARNPMDACVSFYHQSKYCKSFEGEFSDFCEVILSDKYIWCPYTDNILSYWTKRDEPNVLFLKFEDMKRDMNAIIEKTYDFFGIPVPAEQDKRKLINHLSFERMKHNESLKHNKLLNSIRVNNIRVKRIDCTGDADGEDEEEYAFMRKGVTGQYNNEMRPELIQMFNGLILDKLNKCGLCFD